MGQYPKLTARILASVYFSAIFFFAFQPFEFIPTCFFNAEIRWLPEERGVQIDPCSVMGSEKPPISLSRAFQQAKGLAAEVWLTSENNLQRGPARIISYSHDPKHRNFTLGQEKDALVFRLRTTKTDLNGTEPHLSVPGVFRPGTRQHLVVTYDGRREKLYIDGRLHKTGCVLSGDFSNWDPDHYLLLGNELTGNRVWQGELYAVALYDRALDLREVRQNFEAVRSASASAASVGSRVQDGLIGFYDFREKGGDIVRDQSRFGASGDLSRARFRRSLSQTASSPISENFYVRDMVLNIIGFIPLSFILFFNLPVRYRLGRSANYLSYLLPLLMGGAISLFIEHMQQYTLYRNPTLWDVVYNVSGTLMGSFLLRRYLLKKQIFRTFL